MKRNAFVGASGQNYNVASVNELMRPMIWFELTRLYVVANITDTFSLLFDKSDHVRRFLSTQKVSNPQGSSNARFVDRFDYEYDETWKTFCADLLFATDRTSRYMNWRYADHPVFEYQRLEVSSEHGNVYFVWREEKVLDSDSYVARICEIIGEGRAITAGFADFFAVITARKIAFADFFCSHAKTNSALLAGGMRPVVTADEFDLPRLFQPVYRDQRKTINFYYSYIGSDAMPDFYENYRTYITKGDGNQDRPNP